MPEPEEVNSEEQVATEETETSVLLGVHPSDMAIIITGLREMPRAVTQVANAVEVLAENTRRAPTKLGTAVIVAISAVFIVLAVGWQTLQLGNSVADSQAVAEDAKEVAEKTFDCLNYNEKGAPVGDCAQRTVGVISAFAAELTQDVRCQSEIQFYLFLTGNPNLGVTPVPISERCQAQFTESMTE